MPIEVTEAFTTLCCSAMCSTKVPDLATAPSARVVYKPNPGQTNQQKSVTVVTPITFVLRAAGENRKSAVSISQHARTTLKVEQARTVSSQVRRTCTLSRTRKTSRFKANSRRSDRDAPARSQASRTPTTTGSDGLQYMTPFSSLRYRSVSSRTSIESSPNCSRARANRSSLRRKRHSVHQTPDQKRSRALNTPLLRRAPASALGT